MHPTRPSIFPAPAASSTRRTAAGVKTDRGPPEGLGLDPGEDRRTLATAGAANTQVTFIPITCIMSMSGHPLIPYMPVIGLAPVATSCSQLLMAGGPSSSADVLGAITIGVLPRTFISTSWVTRGTPRIHQYVKSTPSRHKVAALLAKIVAQILRAISTDVSDWETARPMRATPA